MRRGSRHAAAALPCSQSASNSVVSSPNSATVTTSGDVFGGNSPAAASPSAGRRQQRLSRGSLSKACPSPPPSVSTSQQQQQRSQRQMKKGPRHHRGGGGRREAQRRRLPGSSASDAAMSKPKVPPSSSLPGRRSSSGGSSGGYGDVAAGMCTVEDVVKSAVDPQAQFTMSSNTSRTTTITADDDGNEADSSCSPLPHQQQQQRPPDQSRRTKGNRDSKPRAVRGRANTQLWENVQKQRRHLQSRQDRRRIAAKSSEASVEAGAAAHNVANEEDEVAGNVQGSAAAPEEEEVTVSCKPRNGSRFSSPPATTAAAAAEETLENEELVPAAGTRRVPGQSAKNAMATPSRRPAVTEGGGRSRHRRRLSPAHPVASSPAVSRGSSINDAVGDAAVDEETQPLPRLSHAGHDDKAAVPADGPRRPLRAGNKLSRRQKQMSTAVPQPQSGPGVATGMAPVTAVAAFSTRPPLPPFVPQDPIIVAQQVRHAAHAVVAESALPDPAPTVMRLAAFSSAKGSITDPCVVAAVLPTSAGAAAHAVGPAVPHGGRVKDTAAPSTAGPPTVVSSRSMPQQQQQQQSEEDKQLSRRGLRLGAAPFYPAATASLILAMTPEAGTNGGDASLPSLAAAVPSPQSLLGSYSMSPARSPPLVRPTSSPLGDSVQNHSRSSTGGLMSGQSTFAAELAAATGTPWTLTVIAPSHSSPPSSIGRDDTDGDGPSSGTPSVPVKSPAHGAAAAASYSSNTEMPNGMGDRPSMRRSALMVTNTATGARVSPATVTTPSGSPTALWSGSGGNGPQMRTSGHTSGASSSTAAAATTSPGGAGHHSATHSGSTPQGVVVREFPQAPYPVVSRTTEPHQSQQQHSMRSPRLMSESDLDCVQHNRVAVSDVVAKDEGSLVDTLFADVNMIEDDESEVDGDDLLSSRDGGERWTMQPAPSPVASGDGSPLVASSPDVRTPHSMNQQLQHRSGSFSAGVRMLGKEAGGQVFGGGYWYPSGPWASTDATGRGSGSGGTGTGSHRGGGGDVKTTLAAAVTASIGSGSGAAAWRGLSTPPHRHRAFSASCASVASTMSLIDPKQPQADGAAYDMMGEDDEWEMNSSAYADSLDEAQIQWIEEQLRATENPAGYF
ncbi:hypothetical protein conserved [Leishmania donovani]|uniref:Uncharacterized protein n=3 Tax=Leishmania donovani species complex TaxID=38574 RepID=A4HS35_LEIIN|nr:conserved hypothetical protein [Leishmania infantum JPCM5]CAC9441009.1 hypothetical_protein_-_conserved [Leishmania infantum]CAJ1985885.1 hypothetical protein conserved [Leishmania donovani]CAM65063.1 conserved hypothetical protein [Leishmania infantum JPCM5]SUZ38836.1 hypothetical_protein_-_conserved [Leishmania infantum]VDZ41789.1 hypothetical_protein_conserved [Leishmania donovani]|eukprot:XP_001462877.1 conserved hypothetical protein [Leishmania infantum JPCM5]